MWAFCKTQMGILERIIGVMLTVVVYGAAVSVFIFVLVKYQPKLNEQMKSHVEKNSSNSEYSVTAVTPESVTTLPTMTSYSATQTSNTETPTGTSQTTMQNLDSGFTAMTSGIETKFDSDSLISLESSTAPTVSTEPVLPEVQIPPLTATESGDQEETTGPSSVTINTNIDVPDGK